MAAFECLSRGFLLLALLIALASSCRAQTEDVQLFCSFGRVAFQPSPNAMPMSFEAPSFGSDERGSSSDVLVRNLGERDIVRLLLVLDYLNEQSERLISVAHYYRDDAILDEDVRTNFEGERRFALLANREDFLRVGNGEEGRISKHGGRKRVSGISDISVTRCPKSALITAIAIEYDNGEIKSFFAPGWHLDVETALPVKGWLPYANDAPLSLVSESGIFTVTVAPNGCASIAGDTAKPSSWIASSVPHWLLSPSQTDGRATTQTIPMAIVVHSPKGVQRGWTADTKLPNVMAVLHIFTVAEPGQLSLGSSLIQRIERRDSHP